MGKTTAANLISAHLLALDVTPMQEKLFSLALLKQKLSPLAMA